MEIGKGTNAKVVLMPLEASSLIGSLGGIGAIAREVFGDNPNGGPAPAAPRSSQQAQRTTPAVGARNTFMPPVPPTSSDNT